MNKNLLLVSALGAAILGAFYAGRATAADAAPSLNANMSIRNAFKAAGDGRISVNLKNGTSYSAKVKDVTGNAVVLKEPTGKEFYEVYVRLDQVAAIEVKVR